jgi:hypothetical protein
VNQKEIRQKLDGAIQKFMEHDLELLSRDVNERSITHRLAMFLQDEFAPEWMVDCEFNRYGFDSKKVLDFYPHGTTTDDTEARTVFPDIIVHKRGPEGPNLLVIEAKKSTNNDGGLDVEKLKRYKSSLHLHYEHAVFLVFRTGKDHPGVEVLQFIE